jgi:small subunit ribosomal protein S4
MARYTGPKDRLSRREGVDLMGTAAPSLQRRLHVPPGGVGRRRRQSEYGIRLRAKQRVKRQYGVLERQFRRYLEEERRMPGLAGENLLQLLERRLDNVVYRLGFARTRPMARQLVSHRHVFVNDKRVNIPSARVSPGDVITLGTKALQIPVVQEELKTGRAVIPSWLVREDGIGRVVGLPRRADIEPDIREDLVVEFYSR